MSRLPFIDEHSRQISAPPDAVWTALLHTLDRALPDLPRGVVSAWGLDPRSRSRRWDAEVAVGDSVPGFAVAELEYPRRLVLRGRHRFSQYELSFDLDPLAPGQTLLRARTSARFPGLMGRLYRTVVITSRGHRLAVRRLLASVASRA